MPTTEVKCIYCQKVVDLRVGDGDHVIPAQLGEFRGDKHFRRICTQCNNQIGRSEQQLLQCGPERLFRELVKPASPSGRKRGRSGGKSAGGAPPPSTVVERQQGRRELVQRDLNDPRNVHSLDQLVVMKDGQEQYIPLYSGMRLEQLRAKLDAVGVSELSGARLDCDDKNWKEFSSLVCGAGAYRIEESEPTEPGVQKVKGVTKVVVNQHYFRALAKIAFHYYLMNNRRDLRGDEPEFKPIREFILNGTGEIDAFFKPPSQKFALPFGPTADGHLRSPTFWSHVLAADESIGAVVVYLHLFLGPGVHRPGTYVTLGPIKSKIFLPIGVWGHLYIYDDPQPTSGKAGRVEALQFTRVK